LGWSEVDVVASSDLYKVRGARGRKAVEDIPSFTKKKPPYIVMDTEPRLMEEVKDIGV
jgi:hypothetical protein